MTCNSIMNSVIRECLPVPSKAACLSLPVRRVLYNGRIGPILRIKGNLHFFNRENRREFKKNYLRSGRDAAAYIRLLEGRGKEEQNEEEEQMNNSNQFRFNDSDNVIGMTAK